MKFKLAVIKFISIIFILNFSLVSTSFAFEIDPWHIHCLQQQYIDKTKEGRKLIDLVKDSTWIDGSMTMDQAFKTYSGFSKVSWHYKNDRRGRKIVTLFGKVDLDFFKKKCGKFWPNKKERIKSMYAGINFYIHPNGDKWTIGTVEWQYNTKKNPDVYAFNQYKESYEINKFFERINNNNVPALCM